jgi:DNA-binding MarR family transcriptional regulator
MSDGLLRRNRSADDDWRYRFVEEMGGLILVHGTPRAVMRVLGWMVVCEPPEQTAPEVQEQLGLSAGSVSTALRGLSDTGVLERVARPGDRRIFYRLSPQGWEQALEARFRALTDLRRLAERALDSAAGGGDKRLVEMRDFYSHMETGVATLIRQSSERKGSRVPGLTLHR